MKEVFDHLILGLLLGIIFPVVGFFIFGGIYTTLIRPDSVMQNYIDIFLHVSDLRSLILSISLIVNVPLFFLFIYLKWDRVSKGILMSFFIYALAIVYFYFF